MQKRQITVNCPTCNDIVIWQEQSRFRPFCSERCRLIDFGDWANERHTIAGMPTSDDDEQQDS